MQGPDALVRSALQMQAAGRHQDAVRTMTAAVDAGEHGALFELAIWYLIGDPVPRDLSRARELLRWARGSGDLDAGVMEVALTANGTGAVPDWAGARALLDDLAPHSAAAKRHQDLVGSMDLADDGAPSRSPTGESLDPAGIVTRFRRLLTEQECAHIAQVATPLLEPALVVDPATRRTTPHPIRTSDGGVIGPTREDLVIRAINRRLAAVSATGIEQGEALTVLRYQRGQQYRLHLDTLPESSNQRVATVLVYLNEGFGGGGTIFPELGLSIVPSAGDAIVYRNVTEDGAPDQRTRHAGQPVTNGVKWLATRWIRARPFDVWTGPESAP